MTKFEALQSIFEVEDIKNKLISYAKAINYDTLLEILSKHSYSLTEVHSNSNMTTKMIKVIWPDKPLNNSKLCNYLFAKYALKYCPHCREVLELYEFSKNSARTTGLNSHCRKCELETRKDYQREYRAGMRAKKLDRTPSWANLDKIKEIFKNCPKGYHIDHIIPLQGKLVSGLHVENNLQYLTGEENLKKQNKYTIE